jgi:hypothetical protein
MSATGRIPTGVVAMCFYACFDFAATAIFIKILQPKKKVEWKQFQRSGSFSYLPVIISDPEDGVLKAICWTGLCISIVGVLLNLALIIVFLSVTSEVEFTVFFTVLFYVLLLLFNGMFFYNWYQLYRNRRGANHHFQALLVE